MYFLDGNANQTLNNSLDSYNYTNNKNFENSDTDSHIHNKSEDKLYKTIIHMY